MEIAIWIIVAIEIVRAIQNAIQLQAYRKSQALADKVNKEFVKEAEELRKAEFKYRGL